MKTRKNEDTGNYHKKILPALIFATIFGAVNSRNELINRLMLYYMTLYISFIPEVISKFNKKEKNIIFFITIIALGTYSILSLKLNQNGVVPYNTFWN